jgi:hypothetical protein
MQETATEQIRLCCLNCIASQHSGFDKLPSRLALRNIFFNRPSDDPIYFSMGRPPGPIESGDQFGTIILLSLQRSQASNPDSSPEE